MTLQTVLTGIKSTSMPHLGNYVGSIRPSIKKINETQGNSYLFIADYHSLTNIHTPSELKKHTHEVACTWLACGLDPKKTMIYRQSQIPELFELYWILSCFTTKGLMNRAHSYKALIQKNIENKKKDTEHGITMGLFNYPILMAADILLFEAECIPVGKDQLQHLEMARDIATKFNQCYKTSLFKQPQPFLDDKNNYLPGIDGRKMSKSYGNDIPLFCTPQELRKKIMKIKTDSLPPEAPKDPNKSILFQIYQSFASSQEIKKMEEKIRQGYGWGQVKNNLIILLENYFSNREEIYQNYLPQSEKIEQILTDGASRARKQASKMIQKIRTTIGIK